MNQAHQEYRSPDSRFVVTGDYAQYRVVLISVDKPFPIELKVDVPGELW